MRTLCRRGILLGLRPDIPDDSVQYAGHTGEVKRLRAKYKPTVPKKRRHWNEQFEELEEWRMALLTRLHRLGDSGANNPALRSALTLLNRKFRLAKLWQRPAILKSAHWLINVLEGHEPTGTKWGS